MLTISNSYALTSIHNRATLLRSYSAILNSKHPLQQRLNAPFYSHKTGKPTTIRDRLISQAGEDPLLVKVLVAGRSSFLALESEVTPIEGKPHADRSTNKSKPQRPKNPPLSTKHGTNTVTVLGRKPKVTLGLEDRRGFVANGATTGEFSVMKESVPSASSYCTLIN